MEKFDYSFLTGSHYTGAYKPKINTMEGFGVYKYPDGSFYRGLFKRGKFHGYGRIALAPRKFIIKGYFEDGELVQVEEILFNDGLRVDVTMKDGKLDFERWKYCTDKDRRFYGEHCHGIQSVGPDSYLTSEMPPRPLPSDTFDAGEGVFKPSTGFIVHREFPFNPYRFVCCKDEADYMTKHYREGPYGDKMKPPSTPISELRKKILISNLKAELLLDRLAKCACFTEEFEKIKSIFMTQKVKSRVDTSSTSVSSNGVASSQSTKRFPLTSSASSRSCFSSLTAENLVENMQKECYKEMKPEKIQLEEHESELSTETIRGRTDTLTSRVSIDFFGNSFLKSL